MSYFMPKQKRIRAVPRTPLGNSKSAGKRSFFGRTIQNPGEIHRNNGDMLRAATDSGMVTAYRPAQHQKPSGPLNAFQALFSKIFKRVPASQTSEQGSAAASPSAYSYELYSLRYERRAVITECRQMYDDDPRCRRSVNMFVREAVRKGVVITVNMPGRGVVGQRARKAQEVCQGIEKILNNNDEGNSKLESWGRMGIVEGDLFIQIVTAGDSPNGIVTDAKRMPAAAMERNTDDTDDFIDPTAAFSHVDVNTNSETATFPLAYMWHGRWQHNDGDKYGNPEIVAARRFRRLLELAEEAQIRRRISRATQRILWNVGSPDKPSDPAIVDLWKEKNGWVEGSMEQYDPVNVGVDYFGNGLLDAKILAGDANVHEIDDIKYYEDVYTSAGLPTPPPLYNLQSEAVNRDVLEDLRAQWLLETQTLSDFLAGAVRRTVDVGLLLAGILPETVTYTVHFSESSIETPNDIIDRALKLFNNGYGMGNSFTWMPLITWKRCIQMVAEFMDIDDVEAEYDLIQRMMQDTDNAAMARAAAMGANVPGASPTDGSSDSEPSDIQGVASKGAPKAIGAPAKTPRGQSRTSSDAPAERGPYSTAQRTPAGAYAGPGQIASRRGATYGEPQEQTDY